LGLFRGPHKLTTQIRKCTPLKILSFDSSNL
jgi:hypothetical protein